MAEILTRDQIRRVDSVAMTRYQMPGLMLMENAGRNAAAALMDEYGPTGHAFICCGPGNNGGDGCVIARHLHNAGWATRLLVTGEEARMSPDMLANYRIVKAMDLDVQVALDEAEQSAAVRSIRGDDVVVDALLGTGFRGAVRNPTAQLIEAINTVDKRALVAVDLPSGLDCDTGAASNATIQADLTITFVAKKTGLISPEAAAYVGRVEVADIGVPKELIVEVATGGS